MTTTITDLNVYAVMTPKGKRNRYDQLNILFLSQRSAEEYVAEHGGFVQCWGVHV